MVLNHYFSNPCEDIFIPYIFMEWIHVVNNMDNNCPDISTLVTHFIRNGYKPLNIGTKSQLTVSGIYPKFSFMIIYRFHLEHLKWKVIDVLWIHEEAKLLYL